jgi:hypothetical protein
LKENESELFSGCSFLCYLTTRSFFQKQKTKFAWFSFCKSKNPSTKIPNNPFKLESITASYCGSKLMRKKNEMALRYFLTFDCHDFFNPASQTCSSKNKKQKILSNSAKSKVLPSNPTYLSNNSAQP